MVDISLVLSIVIAGIGAFIGGLVYNYEKNKELREVKILLVEKLGNFYEYEINKNDVSIFNPAKIYASIAPIDVLIDEDSEAHEKIISLIDDYVEKTKVVDADLSDIIRESSLTLNEIIANLKHSDLR